MSGAGNIIAGGPLYAGLEIIDATENVVAGNWIGTNSSGATNLGNAGHGLDVIDSTNNTIGGPTAEARNIICANGLGGIVIYGQGCSGNLVENDYVGVNGTGESALGNGGYGIFIGEGALEGSTDTGPAFDNTITGVVCSGNASDGVVIGGRGGFRQCGRGQLDRHGRDRINVPAECRLGHPHRGRHLRQHDRRYDGGAGNIIAFNGNNGVTVGLDVLDAAIENAILENAIFSNDGLGIDVDNSAPQAAPVLTSVINNGSQTTIAGTVTGAPNTCFRIEFFSNPAGTSQGKTYLGFFDVMTNGMGSAPFSFSPTSPVAAGLNVTATATDANGNTSEFSAAVTVQTNVTSDLSVKFGGFVYNRTTRQFSQTLTITNISGVPISGPIELVSSTSRTPRSRTRAAWRRAAPTSPC